MRLNGFYPFNIKYNYDNISDFFAQFDKQENKKDLLNNYLIYCFVYKKIDHIKSIITHFNLDTINTRLTFKRDYFSFDLSLVCFGIFCNDIDFVKYLLEKNENYVIDQDYFDYCNIGDEFKLEKATPLFAAASYTKNSDMIDFLIKCGADINARDSKNLTPIMNIFFSHERDKEILEYYQFLISRGANINLQNKAGDTALHYVIRQRNFNVALQLIDKYEANPFLLNNQKRDGLMEFVIHLNMYGEIFSYKNIDYMEKLVNIPGSNPDLIYELFAACVVGNSYIKKKYFSKVKESVILHNDYNSIYWRNKFNDIVGNDKNEYIHSVKALNRLLHVYDLNNIIHIIIFEILKFYESQYDKYIELLMYMLDVISNNLDSFKKLYGNASDIYWMIFDKFLNFVLKNFQKLSLKNILRNYRDMMYKFMTSKNFLKNEQNDYETLVSIIHESIYNIYEKYFYNNVNRKMIEKYIEEEYPINLVNDNCILHTIIARYDNDHKILYSFLAFIIQCNNFKRLNFQDNEYSTPYQLAIMLNINRDIIQLLE